MMSHAMPRNAENHRKHEKDWMDNGFSQRETYRRKGMVFSSEFVVTSDNDSSSIVEELVALIGFIIDVIRVTKDLFGVFSRNSGKGEK